MTREHLPNRRPNETVDVRFDGMDIALTFGFTDDGRITEVFASTRKVGTSVDTMARDIAILLSLNLQYGATPSVLQRSLTSKEDGSPEGLAGAIVAMIRERQAA